MPCRFVKALGFLARWCCVCGVLEAELTEFSLQKVATKKCHLSTAQTVLPWAAPFFPMGHEIPPCLITVLPLDHHPQGSNLDTTVQIQALLAAVSGKESWSGHYLLCDSSKSLSFMRLQCPLL